MGAAVAALTQGGPVLQIPVGCPLAHRPRLRLHRRLPQFIKRPSLPPLRSQTRIRLPLQEEELHPPRHLRCSTLAE